MMKGTDNPFLNFHICTQEELLVNYVEMSAGPASRIAKQHEWPVPR